MKRREIRASKPVRLVPTLPEKKEVWDSTEFDKIDIDRIKKAYQEHYAEHVEFLVNLVASRLALDTAMTNVERGLVESSSGSVEFKTLATTAAIEQAYEVGLRLYVYERVIRGTIEDEDTRKEVLKALLSLNSFKPGGKPPSAIAVGRSQVEGDIQNIEDGLKQRLGPPGEERKPKATLRRKK